MISPIYWHPIIYRFVIKLLYGQDYKNRYLTITKEIGNLNVLDLCCGDCEISKYLKQNKYKGVDFNKIFVEYAKRKKLQVSYGDINNQFIPKEECVLMQGSLYHFFPHHEKILREMLDSSIKKTIISESVKNVTNSSNYFFKKIALFLSKTKKGSYEKRFTKEELLKLAQKFKASKIIEMDKDLIMVFNK